MVGDAFGETMYGGFWISFLMATAISLTILSRGRTSLGRQMISSTVVCQVLACAAIVVGSFLGDGFGTGLAVAGALALGGAFGLLYLAWGERLSLVGLKAVPVVVPVAFLARPVLASASMLLGQSERLAIFCVVTAVAAALLIFPVEAFGRDQPNVASTGDDFAPKKPFAAQDCLVVFCCFVCIGFMEGLPTSALGAWSVEATTASFFVATIVSIAIIRFFGSLTFGELSGFLAGTAAVGLFLVVYASGGLAVVASSIFLVIRLMMFIFLFVAGVQRSLVTHQCLGRTLGVVLGVTFFGTIAGTLARLSSEVIDPDLMAFALVAFMCCVLAAVSAKREQPPLVIRERVDVREAACERVSASCSLTSREAEILGLLVKGRSVPSICERLFITKNTVNTHIRHIYEKTGVKTKQELIDLVEDELG